MSDTRAERQAGDISAPVEGSIFVLALTTAASAEQDFIAAAYFNAAIISPQYVTMKCSVRWYVTFKDITGVTNPDETATTGAARTWEIAADEPFNVRICAGYTPPGASAAVDVRRFWKAKGSAAGNLRIYPSSASSAAAG